MKKLLIATLLFCAGMQSFAQADMAIQNVLMSPNPIQVGQSGLITALVRNNGNINITAGCVIVTISVPAEIGVATLTLDPSSDPIWTVYNGGSGAGFIDIRNTGGVLPNDFANHPIVLNVSADAPLVPPGTTIVATIALTPGAIQPLCAALGDANPANNTATTSVIVTGIYTWTGVNSTDWSDAGNWLPTAVPLATEKAIIPDVSGASGNFPLLSASVGINELQVDAGAFVDLGGQTFTINGAVTGTGTLSGDAFPASNLVITGVAGTLYFTPGSNSLRNFTLNAAATATLGSALDIIPNTLGSPGTVTVNAGALLNSAGNLTIKSNNIATARVGNSAGTITGDVTVERYIANPQRSWHLLSTNTVGSQTIRDAWQEGGAVVAQKGTWMTSGNTLLPGFDATSPNGISILIHDQTIPSWTSIPVTNTNSTALSSRPGYFLFVRGDRTSTTLGSPPTPTVLRSKGLLKQGTLPAVVVSSTGTGRTLVGNPYASAINMEPIFVGTPNLDQNMLVWDPALTGSFGVGGYRAIVRTGVNTYTHTPVVLGTPTTSNANARFIHSGQAFFLKATTTNASVVFTEAVKTASTPAVIYNPIVPEKGDQTIIANLMIPQPGGVVSLADGIRISYNSAYSAALTDDIEKMGNWGENLSSLRNGTRLIVEKRPMIQSGDIIYLRMSNTAVKDYRFQIGTIDFVQANVKAYLEDTYLKKLTPLDLSGAINNVDFSITVDQASANPDRFRIVFSLAGPLPQTITTIKAAQQGSNITVDWKATNQYEMKQYEVEKSIDGTNFTKVETQASIGLNGSDANYNWLDANAVTGNNYYRIRSVRLSGETKYSDVVNVVIGKVQAGITVYPNPVTNKKASLLFSGMEKGVYELRLINSASQVILTTIINHPGGNAIHPVNLIKAVAGNYNLEIVSPDKTKMAKTINVLN